VPQRAFAASRQVPSKPADVLPDDASFFFGVLGTDSAQL
jgi:hypothetical protein